MRGLVRFVAVAALLFIAQDALAQTCGHGTRRPGFCRSSDLTFLRVLKGGPTTAQIAAGSLTPNKGGVITTTRASSKLCLNASGVYTSVSANQPCVEQNGFLVNRAKTNFLIQSADVSNAAWTKNQVTVSAGDSSCNPAPDGTSTAALVTPTGGATDSYVFQSVTNSTQAMFSAGIWVRLPTGSSMSTGTMNLYQDGSFTPAGNVAVYPTKGWKQWQVPLDYSATVHTTKRFIFGSSTSWVQADGPVCLWGAGLTNGTSAGNPIVTGASAVTVAADVPSVALTTAMSGTNGCVRACFVPQFDGPTGFSAFIPAGQLFYMAGGSGFGLQYFNAGLDTIYNFDGSTVAALTANMTRNVGQCMTSEWIGGLYHRVTRADTGAVSSAAFTTFGALGSTMLLGTDGSSVWADGWLSDIAAGPAGTCGAQTLAPKRPRTVSFLGDSITRGYAVTVPYPLRVEGNTTGAVYTSFNYGADGETSAQILSRWSAYARGAHSEHVVILAGVNDAQTDVPAATAWANIKAMADQARGDGSIVHLVTVMPWKGWGTWSAPRQAIADSINASITAYCTANSLSCYDAYAAFGGQGGDPQTMQTIWDSTDHLHPNDLGAQKLADAVRALLP